MHDRIPNLGNRLLLACVRTVHFLKFTDARQCGSNPSNTVDQETTDTATASELHGLPRRL